MGEPGPSGASLNDWTHVERSREFPTLDILKDFRHALKRAMLSAAISTGLYSFSCQQYLIMSAAAYLRQSERQAFIRPYDLIIHHNVDDYMFSAISIRTSSAIKDPDLIIVAIKGTQPNIVKTDPKAFWTQLRADVNLTKVNADSKYKQNLEAQFVSIKADKKDRHIVLTGHSLGASMARHIARQNNYDSMIFCPGPRIFADNYPAYTAMTIAIMPENDPIGFLPGPSTYNQVIVHLPSTDRYFNFWYSFITFAGHSLRQYLQAYHDIDTKIIGHFMCKGISQHDPEIRTFTHHQTESPPLTPLGGIDEPQDPWLETGGAQRSTKRRSKSKKTLGDKMNRQYTRRITQSNKSRQTRKRRVASGRKLRKSPNRARLR